MVGSVGGGRYVRVPSSGKRGSGHYFSTAGAGLPQQAVISITS